MERNPSLAVPRFRGGAKSPRRCNDGIGKSSGSSSSRTNLRAGAHRWRSRDSRSSRLVKQTMMIASRKRWDIDDWTVLAQHRSGERFVVLRAIAAGHHTLAAEILNARPYAFLDNAPLERRRTQAVTRARLREKRQRRPQVWLDAAAMDRVKAEAWPEATSADELHDALMLIGAMTPEEIQRSGTRERGAIRINPGRPEPGDASLCSRAACQWPRGFGV